MKKNYKDDKERKPQEINESSVNYQFKNRIRFYKSFAEETTANHKYLASLSPEKHFANAKQLIDRIYTKKLKNRKKNKKITFN